MPTFTQPAQKWGQVDNYVFAWYAGVMARPLRLEYPGALYHITSRGDRREVIFEDDEDRCQFLEILNSVVTNHNWLCHTYCLMDNHYHLIIETLDANLSKGMRQLNGVFTQASNRRHQRSGHLFQGRYKAILVEKESYLLELSRYVVLNPVKAKGMVKRIEDWQWSSYPATVGLAHPPGWLTIDWVLSQFGQDRKSAITAYQHFVHEGLNREINLWSHLKGQIYLGNDKFVASTQKMISKDQKQDWNISNRQTRPPPPPIASIAQQEPDRNAVIRKAYATGAYSQREIGEFYNLHPSTVGVIVRQTRS